MSYKKKRSRKPLTLEEAQLRMVDAINQCERIIATGEDNQKIQAMNALSGLISRYSKLFETVELEKRISDLEAAQKMRRVS